MRIKNSLFIPVALTILLIVGTAWSWVSQKSESVAAPNIETELINFASTGEGVSEGTVPACCAGSATSKESAPACCAGEGETSSLAGESKLPSCCAGSASSKTAEAEGTNLDTETAAMIANVKVPQAED